MAQRSAVRGTAAAGCNIRLVAPHPGAPGFRHRRPLPRSAATVVAVVLGDLVQPPLKVAEEFQAGSRMLQWPTRTSAAKGGQPQGTALAALVLVQLVAHESVVPHRRAVAPHPLPPVAVVHSAVLPGMRSVVAHSAGHRRRCPSVVTHQQLHNGRKSRRPELPSLSRLVRKGYRW